MGYTLAEKILASHTEDGKADAGEIIDASVDLLMVHEVLGSRIIPVLEEMGFEKVWDPNRVFVVNDHWAPASDTHSAEIHIKNREFVKKHGIKHFSDVECGICHQVEIASDAVSNTFEGIVPCPSGSDHLIMDPLIA